jgi:hypothetical protein
MRISSVRAPLEVGCARMPIVHVCTGRERPCRPLQLLLADAEARSWQLPALWIVIGAEPSLLTCTCRTAPTAPAATGRIRSSSAASR